MYKIHFIFSKPFSPDIVPIQTRPYLYDNQKYKYHYFNDLHFMCFDFKRIKQAIFIMKNTVLKKKI